MNICDSIKHLKLWMAKEPINKLRRQVAEWIKTSITHETRKKGHGWGVGWGGGAQQQRTCLSGERPGFNSQC